MQEVKTFTTRFFKEEARDQMVKDSKEMAKSSWRLHSVTDEGAKTDTEG